jgi:transposase
MQDAKPEQRRRHEPEFKRQVLAQCAEPGASVTQITLSHGLNANLVHNWRRLASGAPYEPASPEFIPIALAPTLHAIAPAPPIELDLLRGPLCLRVRWPASVTAACVAWLRELRKQPASTC